MEKVMTMLLLQTIDSQWKDHLLSIDHLKEGIGLRGYGQKNPKEEYKREAYSLFMEMMGRIRQEFLTKLFRVQLGRGRGDGTGAAGGNPTPERGFSISLAVMERPVRSRWSAMKKKLAGTTPAPVEVAKNIKSAAESKFLPVF